MATVRSILKSYFLTGKKPTQSQFSALIDSFLHLSEDTISITQITNLANVLAGKASTAQIDALVQALTVKQDKENQLLTGCEYSTQATTATVTPGTWLVNGLVYEKTTITSFIKPALAPTGKVRTVAIYGQADGQIVQIVSGSADIAITPENNVANSALLRWAIISDSSYLTQPITYSKFTNIAQNAHGTHPAFTNQNQLNIWLLQNMQTAPSNNSFSYTFPFTLA